MDLRVGTVTNVYSSAGKLKVNFEDENNTSLQLPMLTMNDEYSMPKVGDRVLSLHMSNGSVKGVVLGTYYGGGTQPLANSGYRKDFTSGVYARATGGTYKLKGSKVGISGSGASVSLSANASVVGTEVTLGSAAASENEDDEIEPDVYLKITEDNLEAKALVDVTVEAEGGMIDIKSTASDAELLLDAESTLKATTLSVEADDLTLKCSYGTITLEELMKRVERIEDQLGLPHTI